MEENIKKTAVVVGRFQVPKLHLGHIYLISTALQEYNQVLIILGESLQRDERNPYTLQERDKMIRRVFGHGNLEFRAITDVPEDDKRWSDTIDEILRFFHDPVLLHSRDSFASHYTGRYPLREIPELPGYSGTKLRQDLMDDGDIRLARGEDGWG